MTTLNFITKQEAALYARCCTRTIERAVSLGRLRATKRDGKTVLIRATDLETWLLGCPLAETAKRGRGRPPKVKARPMPVFTHQSHAA
jgi:excisionase family DNA binding protein